ncbi:MAG: clostripain-related cysteine peptidase [Methanocorpusculum sp.]|nr:clostripain-related cysteine peptidase [Methanocorpusculum sp.]
MITSVALLILASTATAVSAEDDNFIVMYVVGSDLETNYNFATNNLIDLANNLDESAGDVIICYGGANKAGWNDGVTITNLSLLADDAEDGVIGVDTATGKTTEFILTRYSGDMSTPELLGTSLAYADDYGEANGLTNANRYIIFWDHGGAWIGFGTNVVTGKTMSLEELAEGMSAAEKYDMIVFNACLMGSIEVANALYPYADYMLASEESTPAIKGLNYTGLGIALSENPSMTPKQLADVLIDTYIPESIGMHVPKVQALVDLNRVPAVISALDTFGDNLDRTLAYNETTAVLGSIISFVQDFGVNGFGGGARAVPYSEDLYDFAGIVRDGTRDAELKASADTLINELERYIIRTESNGGFAAVGGVSIVSPVIYNMLISGTPNHSADELPENYRSGIYLGENNGWNAFLDNYTISVIEKDQAISASIDNESENVTVTSSTGTTKATINYVYDNDGQFVVIGEVPMEESIVSSNSSVWLYEPTGKYAFPEWNGKWLVLANPGDKDGVIISARYFNDGSTGQSMYSVSGNLTRNVNGSENTYQAFLILMVDADTLKPYTIMVNAPDSSAEGIGTNLLGSTDIIPGDVFTPVLTIYDAETDTANETVMSKQSFVFGENPLENFAVVKFADDKVYWYMAAEDMMDMDTYILSDPNMPASASSPAPFFGILVGLAAAGLLLRRK